jgi:hypothetical protein
MILKRGSILLSFLVLCAIVLSTAAAFSTQSIILSRSSAQEYYYNQAEKITDSLISDIMQKYMRFGPDFDNLYPDWTDNCLQEDNWLCKMDLSLDENGGVVDVWGQYENSIVHKRASISANLYGQVMLTSINKINQ